MIRGRERKKRVPSRPQEGAFQMGLPFWLNDPEAPPDKGFRYRIDQT